MLTSFVQGKPYIPKGKKKDVIKSLTIFKRKKNAITAFLTSWMINYLERFWKSLEAILEANKRTS